MASSRGGIMHYPTLGTVLMVEDVLKENEVVKNKAELGRKLPKKMMYQTLNLILDYLEYRGIIALAPNGEIHWIHNPSPGLKDRIRRSVRVK